MVNERAVAVALDALKQAKWLDITIGTYLEPGYDLQEYLLKLPKTTDVQGLVPKIRKDCVCCALGACLLAKANLYDAVPLKQLYGGSTSYKRIELQGDNAYSALRDVFGTKQCELIESAFEFDDMSKTPGSVNHRKEVRRAEAFGDQYVNDHDRFVAIMENIVINGGVFVPPPVKDEDEQV